MSVNAKAGSTAILAKDEEVEIALKPAKYLHCWIKGEHWLECRNNRLYYSLSCFINEEEDFMESNFARLSYKL